MTLNFDKPKERSSGWKIFMSMFFTVYVQNNAIPVAETGRHFKTQTNPIFTDPQTMVRKIPNQGPTCGGN